MRCEKVSLFRGTVTFRGWHLHENARKLKKQVLIKTVVLMQYSTLPPQVVKFRLSPFLSV